MELTLQGTCGAGAAWASDPAKLLGIGLSYPLFHRHSTGYSRQNLAASYSTVRGCGVSCGRALPKRPCRKPFSLPRACLTACTDQTMWTLPRTIARPNLAILSSARAWNLGCGCRNRHAALCACCPVTHRPGSTSCHAHAGLLSTRFLRLRLVQFLRAVGLGVTMWYATCVISICAQLAVLFGHTALRCNFGLQLFPTISSAGSGLMFRWGCAPFSSHSLLINRACRYTPVALWLETPKVFASPLTRGQDRPVAEGSSLPGPELPWTGCLDHHQSISRRGVRSLPRVA